MAQPPVPPQYRGAGYYTPPGVNASNPMDVRKDVPPGYTDANRTITRTHVVAGPDTVNNKAFNGIVAGSDPKVAAMQNFLNHQGFNLKVDGVNGQATRAAAAAFRAHAHAKAVGAAPPLVSENGDGPGPSGATTTPTPPATTPAAAGPPPTDLTALLKQLMAQGGQVGQQIPMGWAGQMAGAEFDPQIQQMMLAQQMQPRQAAQDQADIGNWNQQLQTMMGTAATQTQGAYDNAAKATGDATAGIVSSLGGAANAGSAGIGQMGVLDAGTLAAMGANAKSTQGMMSPMVKLAENQALASNKAQQSQSALSNAQQLAATQGQKAQSIYGHKADIMSANNSLAQQRFANKFGGAQAIASTEVAMGTAANQAVKDSYTIAKDKLALVKGNIWINNQLNKPPAGSFGSVKVNDKTKIWTDAGTGLFYQPNDAAVLNHQATAGQAKFTDLNAAVKTINDALRARGFKSDDPGARKYRDTMLMQMLGPWMKKQGISKIPKAWETNW